MSRYAALTVELRKREERFVTFSFDELDIIVGGLPPSAHSWGAWWTNSKRSRPHSRFWLDAGRRVSVDLFKKVVVFALDASIEGEEIAEALLDVATPETLPEYMSNSLSMERQLEEQLVTFPIDGFSAMDLVCAFSSVAELAGVSIPLGDIEVVELPEPHRRPSSLPKGKSAVYVFMFGNSCLKVGKAGPRSSARFCSQHYGLNAPSTLAKSLITHQGRLGLTDLHASNVGDWICTNTRRVNFLIPSSYGAAILSLLEAFVQCRLNPEFEGFESQRGTQAGTRFGPVD